MGGDRVVAAERARLIAEHLPLASYLARRFAERGEAYEDLAQTASLALVLAADRFDPTLGYAFSTYATRTIVGELKHHFRDRAWAVKTPRSMQEAYLELRATAAELTQALGRSPTVRELASASGRHEVEVLAAMEAGQGYRAAPLEAATGEGPGEARAAGADPATAVDDRAELRAHLARLAPREREVLRLRFVEERSQNEIAELLGISQMTVSRLIRRALGELREAFRAG
jgi:RNA polymerase sigma-B factor